MIVNIILGVNIDTSVIIKKLKIKGDNSIIVVNYDSVEKPFFIDDVLYLRPLDLKNELSKYETIIFHKTMYAFPHSDL